jgi:hypothetical protein
VSAEHKLGEVGTEIAPDAGDAARLDVLLRHVCHLARSLTGAERGALALKATEDDTPRKYFSLSAAYAPWHDFRPDPKGLGLHGLEIPPGYGGYRYGPLQLSDKSRGRLHRRGRNPHPRAGRPGRRRPGRAALDRRARGRPTFPLHSVRPAAQDGSDALQAEQVVVRSV